VPGSHSALLRLLGSQVARVPPNTPTRAEDSIVLGQVLVRHNAAAGQYADAIQNEGAIVSATVTVQEHVSQS